MRAQALVRLPYISKEAQLLGDICSQRHLAFESVYATTPSGKPLRTEDKFLVQNIRTFGVTELDIVMDLYSGVKEIVDLENRLKPVVTVAENQLKSIETLETDKVAKFLPKTKAAVPKSVKT